MGDRLAVMPGGREVRVRGMQSHGEPRDHLSVGDRAALNLTGVEVADLGRGDWLCEPEAFLPTNRLDVDLTALTESPPVKHRDRVHFHLGTGEVLGRIYLPDSVEAIPSGGRAFAQLRLESPMTAARGDRFVIRRYSPLETLGGGEVLDPLPDLRRRDDTPSWEAMAVLAEAAPRQALERKVLQAGVAGLPLDRARAFVGLPPAALEALIRGLEERGLVVRLGIAAGVLLAHREILLRARAAVLSRVDDFHRRFPDQLGLTRARCLSDLAADFSPALVERALDDLTGSILVLEKGVFHRLEHRIQLESVAEEQTRRIEAILQEGGFTPPGLATLAKQAALPQPELLRLLGVLQAQDRVVRVDDYYWSAVAIRRAWDVIREELTGGEGRTTSQLREALGCPRRYAVALLEHFDRSGRTQRREDFRFPGPRFHDLA
jgi:selenocysteine-specific elongation factor